MVDMNRSDGSDQAPGSSSAVSESQSADAEELHYLTWFQRFAFGFGHFYNDVCAGMWFTYLLVYFKKILLFSPFSAGNVFLVGQVADALSTPLIGIESDRVNSAVCCNWYGRRKSWHLIGTICVTISFPFIFNRCIGCTYEPVMTAEWVQLIYYIPFVVLFQFGWAAVQVAHLAMIPELTPCNNERTALNGIRYAFTVVASLVAFLLVWLFLKKSIGNQDVTPNDACAFSTSAYVSIGMGIVLTIAFHIFVPDKSSGMYLHKQTMKRAMAISSVEAVANGAVTQISTTTTDSKVQPNSVKAMTWRSWLKEPQFYEVGAIYMCVRLFNNVFMAYIPLYILDTQMLGKPGVAIGVVFGIGTCVWSFFKGLGYQIFGLAIALGISSALLIVNALALMTDMIGKDTVMNMKFLFLFCS
ncbi:unnamed protein product [Soboliphyme baturini]|uniref:Major facilitator superfamily domain-containing protein 12 n=1 Tax=Soboliphyme baturini TaxID=241478 RepID=A0A183IHG3_9BILA|nr:unnamed protein product [Soboliphyme baturini]